MSGKGSNQRPTDMARFGSNYDLVFGKAELGSFGFIITDPESYGSAASRRPTTLEQVEINTYRERYKRAMGTAPEGIHVLPFTNTAVFLPTE